MGEKFMSKKLLYIWIDKWRCFENDEFNFSKEYNIHFDKNKNKLAICKTNFIPIENFYGKNIDCKTIVGNNGTGKTSLLLHILHHGNGDGLMCDNKSSYISIFLDDSTKERKLVLFYHAVTSDGVNNRDLFIENPNCLKIERFLTTSDFHFTYLNSNIREYFKNFPILYITEASNAIITNEFSGQSIKTPLTQLARIIQFDSNNDDPLNTYIVNRSMLQIEFLSKYKNCLSNFDLSLPTFAYFTINTLNKFENENQELYSSIIKYFSKFGSSVFDYYLSISLLEHFNDERLNNWFLNLISNEEKSKFYIFKFKTPLFLFKVYFKENGFLTYNCKDVLMLIDSLFDIINSNLILSCHYNSGKISLSENNAFEKIRNLIKISNILFNYKQIISFSLPMSSGEQTLLNTFANIISSSIDCIDGKFIGSSNVACDDVLLLLDEAEVSLHPEWQRNFVCSLLKMINKVFPNTHFQIIFSTHSPIILSDFLQEDILYINNKNKILNDVRSKTFGANIYDLYNDSFLLTKFIGEFSYNKITFIIKNLKIFEDKCRNKEYKVSVEDYEELNNNQRLIDSIGDPLIRNELLKMILNIKKTIGTKQ